jgi:hypothetical protein
MPKPLWAWEKLDGTLWAPPRYGTTMTATHARVCRDLAKGAGVPGRAVKVEVRRIKEVGRHD